jgi:hypothetical protein
MERSFSDWDEPEPGMQVDGPIGLMILDDAGTGPTTGLQRTGTGGGFYTASIRLAVASRYTIT